MTIVHGITIDYYDGNRQLVYANYVRNKGEEDLLNKIEIYQSRRRYYNHF